MKKLDNIPSFTLPTGLLVESVEVKHLNFVAFVEATHRATDTKAYHRARLKASIFLNGVAITDEQIPLLPISAAKIMLNSVDGPVVAGGSVITPKANGVDNPIIFRLGTPLRMKNKETEVLISELEFFAKTFGDLEDVLAESSPMKQVVELLRRMAVPLGVPSLPTLTEHLLGQISIADGLLMAQKVLPPFVD